MGTKYQSLTICRHCGFSFLQMKECWGSCDFENDYIKKESCLFCRHIKEIDIAKLYPELQEVK